MAGVKGAARRHVGKVKRAREGRAGQGCGGGGVEQARGRRLARAARPSLSQLSGCRTNEAARRSDDVAVGASRPKARSRVPGSARASNRRAASPRSPGSKPRWLPWRLLLSRPAQAWSGDC